VDDNRRRGKVLAARELIYKKNKQVNCKAIEELLQETSLVPTAVRSVSPFHFFNLKIQSENRRTPFLTAYHILGSTYIQ
jgi:hypothetical protein